MNETHNMNDNRDGGPAFPRSTTDHCYGQEGMTLRDYFAAASIGQLITEQSVLEAAQDANQPISHVVASIAYDIADAMLKVREVKP